MAYRIRVLSTSSEVVLLEEMRAALAEEHLDAVLTLQTGSETEWTQALLSHGSGKEIAIIERHLVEPASMAEGEIAEFLEEIADCKPESAVAWLRGFLPKVRCIYSFQLLPGRDFKNGWEIIGEVKSEVWYAAPSIIQADGEGFSNEDGYHILWQFSQTVKGTWWMGVLKEYEWIHFQMDLGNPEHRDAFLAGNVPAGAKLA